MGPGGARSPNAFLVHSELKSRHLVALISMTFLRNNLPNVMQFEHLRLIIVVVALIVLSLFFTGRKRRPLGIRIEAPDSIY